MGRPDSSGRGTRRAPASRVLFVRVDTLVTLAAETNGGPAIPPFENTLSKQQIENGLPDALDLMVVCIEAGCPMDHAIAKTGEELALAYPALAEEMQIMTTEVQAGRYPVREAATIYALRKASRNSR